MPADTPIVGLALWRKAKTDPPGINVQGYVPTDEGSLRYGPLTAYGTPSTWYWETHDGEQMVADPQPSLWCNPSPPVAGPHGTLTLADLHTVVRMAAFVVASSSVLDGEEAAVQRVRELLPKEGTGSPRGPGSGVDGSA